MNYYPESLTPETLGPPFNRTARRVSGFSKKQAVQASKVKKGDIFVRYPVRVSQVVFA